MYENMRHTNMTKLFLEHLIFRIVISRVAYNIFVRLIKFMKEIYKLL